MHPEDQCFCKDVYETKDGAAVVCETCGNLYKITSRGLPDSVTIKDRIFKKTYHRA